jgi:hypothetical protein
MPEYPGFEELHRSWTPPPELTRSAPRPVRLKGAGIALVVLAVVMSLGAVAASVGLGVLSSRQAADRRLMREQGVDTTARVTRHWTQNNGKERNHLVDYTFDWEGRDYDGRSHLPLKLWRTLELGSPLPVRLLPANPNRNHPRDWEPTVLPPWVALLVGVILATVGGLLLYAVRRQMRLLSEGRPAPGIVRRYSFAQHGQKNIHYDFMLLSGAIAKGRSGPSRKLPPIGGAICVIYEPDNPRHNARYPLELVRLATP